MVPWDGMSSTSNWVRSKAGTLWIGRPVHSGNVCKPGTDSGYITATFRGGPKRQWRGRTWLMGKLVSNAFGHAHVCKEKWPEARTYTEFLAQVSSLVIFSENFYDYNENFITKFYLSIQSFKLEFLIFVYDSFCFLSNDLILYIHFGVPKSLFDLNMIFWATVTFDI